MFVLSFPDEGATPNLETAIEEQLGVRIIGNPEIATGLGVVTDVRMEVGDTVQNCFVESVGDDTYNVACETGNGTYVAPLIQIP